MCSSASAGRIRARVLLLHAAQIARADAVADVGELQRTAVRRRTRGSGSLALAGVDRPRARPRPRRTRARRPGRSRRSPACCSAVRISTCACSSAAEKSGASRLAPRAADRVLALLQHEELARNDVTLRSARCAAGARLSPPRCGRTPRRRGARPRRRRDVARAARTGVRPARHQAPSASCGATRPRRRDNGRPESRARAAPVHVASRSCAPCRGGVSTLAWRAARRRIRRRGRCAGARRASAASCSDAATIVFRMRLLQPRFDSEEPALRDQRGDRLPRVLGVERRRLVLATSPASRASRTRPQRSSSHDREETDALEPRRIATHLAAAARERSSLAATASISRLQVGGRLLDARRGDAQVRVVGDRLA